MSLLNLNGPAGKAPRSKNSSRAWMGIGLVIAVLGIGSTFASSITINSGADTEFGQGVQRTVYCGGDNVSLKVTPISSYKNKSGSTTDPAGTFYINAIKVSDIPAACDGVNFVVSLYNTTADSSALPIATSTAVTFTSPAVYWRTAATSVGTTALNTTYKGPSGNSSSSGCQATTSSKFTGNSNTGALLSASRSAYVDPCTVAYLTVKSNTFQINIKSGTGITNSDIVTAGRIVIETQEDAFGVDSVKTDSKSSNSYGLIYDGLS